jgi:probable rRNA maturation factor|tara:strand:- start:777 stop:1319 length:543 start_codon:yes stop_codon:yes gene_type:complete
MYQKDLYDLQIDLVFKCNDFSNLSDHFLNKPDNLIFESGFWEEVLLCWIKIILDEKDTSFPNFILDKKSFSLSLQIINDNEISSINQKWMNKSGSTDVLSFPIISDEDTTKDLNFIELGDLFISLETAFKQSLEFNHSIKKEMLWLASHGLLHLLGWEHNDDYELDNMLNFQEYLISKLD